MGCGEEPLVRSHKQLIPYNKPFAFKHPVFMTINEASQLQMLICDQASSYVGNSYVMFKMFSISP